MTDKERTGSDDDLGAMEHSMYRWGNHERTMRREASTYEVSFTSHTVEKWPQLLV